MALSTNRSTIYNFGSALNASARPSQFRVTINVPVMVTQKVATMDGINEGAGDIVSTFNFLTHQATLPNYVTQDCMVHYRGRPYHESGEREYNPWGCTIYNSGDFVLRAVIERWVELMHSTTIVNGETRPERYKGSILIEQMDRQDNVLRAYKLVGAFPSDTGTVDLSFENGSQIETFSPQFIYDYFIVAPNAQALAGIEQLTYTQASQVNMQTSNVGGTAYDIA